VSKLALHGRSASSIREEIADAVKVSTSTVKAWLRRLDSEHLERADESTRLRIAKHHAQLDDVIAEAWQSFESSRRAEPIKVFDREATGGFRYEDGPGDPRFLAVIISAMDRRAKLLGTDRSTEPAGPFIANPLRDVDLTIEQAAELMTASGAHLLSLSARCQAEIAAAKSKALAEQSGS
jgi:hypothetical protein